MANFRAVICLVPFVAFAIQPLFAADAKRDGIVANLSVSTDEAILRWRFLRRLQKDEEVRGYEVKLNDQDLPASTWRPYLSQGEITRVLSLLDVTGKNRGSEITRQIAAMLWLANNFRVALGKYSSGTRVLVPNNFDEWVEALSGIEPEDVEPDMAGALYAGIGALASLPAQRRGLFLFTDGHAGPRLVNDLGPAAPAPAGAGPSDGGCSNNCASKVAEIALQHGVALSFILSSGKRPVDRGMLERLAESTGGQVVAERDLAAFLSNPFWLLDSGGSVFVPIPPVRRYFWQPDPLVSMTLFYGDKSLKLTDPVPVATASIRETVGHLASKHPVGLFGSVGAMVALGALALVGLQRRRKATTGIRAPNTADHREEAARRPVLAILQNIGDGRGYQIQAPVVHIGRASANEIVLEDETVSRLHAVLQQGGHGEFSIENRSGLNGTLVNHLPIETMTLADGDLITLGSTTLRFCQLAQGNDKSHVAASKQNTPSSASA